MSSKIASIPMNLDIPGPVSQESLTLAGDEFPLLVDALNGPRGDALAAEMSTLIKRFRRDRAQRRPTKVFARLSVPSAEDAFHEELVVVQDVSRSGVRVAIPRSVSLDLRELATAHLVLQLGEPGDEHPVELPVSFVREHGADDRYTFVAFRFEALDGNRAELLDHVSNLFFA